MDYFSRFYSETFFPYLVENEIDQVLHLGDLVERRKFINFVTLNRMKSDYFEKASELGIQNTVIVGNHDMPYRSRSDVSALSEIFGRENWYGVTYVDEPTEVWFGDLQALLVPWIHAENYELTSRMIKNTGAQVLFGHLAIRGFEMHRGQPSHDGLEPDDFKNFDLVASGHFHHRHTRGNIHYLGSPYEITWHDYDDPRGFHVFDTETRKMKFVENPFKMFHKVWYDDSESSRDEILSKDFSELKGCQVKIIVTTKNDPYTFDQFIDAVGAVEPDKITVVEDHRHVDDVSEEEIAASAEDTLSVLTRYVDSLDIKQKLKVKNFLTELYMEAQSRDFS